MTTVSPGMPSAWVNGIAVYDLGGPADALGLLLLHGYSDSGQCWGGAVQRWSDRYRLWSLDARGHGRSERFIPEQLAGWPPTVMVHDTVAVLEHLAGHTGPAPVLVGHSMGGGVAASVALARPDLVTGIVLEDPALGVSESENERRERGAREVAYLAHVRADPAWGRQDGRESHPCLPEVEREPWERAKQLTDEGLAATWRLRSAASWDVVLAELRVPTLLVTGTEDVLWPEPMPDRIRALAAPGVQVAVVDGAEHAVRRTRTQAFHAVVDPWLAELDAAANRRG